MKKSMPMIAKLEVMGNTLRHEMIETGSATAILCQQ
jgi:hypothetical protein